MQSRQLKLLLKDLLFPALKLPLIYLVLGAACVAVSYIDDILGLKHWNNFFNITEIIGEILVVFAVATFVYNLVISLCLNYEIKWRDSHPILSLILANIRTGLHALFILIMLNIIITMIAPSGSYLHLANNIIKIVIICSIGWIAIQVLYTIEAGTHQYMLNITHTEQRRAKALYTKMRIIRNIVTAIIIVVSIAAILMSFDSFRDLGISLLASAGFLTAIIGLSAQKALFSLFAGLQIAISQPIKIGDVVVIEGESGIVEEITFTFVTLKLGDRRRMMIPIHFFVEKPFENWSHDGDSLRSSFSIYVDYFLPIEPIREALNQIVNESELWDKKAHKLEVANISERCVELRIQVSAENADNLSDLRAEVREKILMFIRSKYPDHFPKTYGK